MSLIPTIKCIYTHTASNWNAIFLLALCFGARFSRLILHPLLFHTHVKKPLLFSTLRGVKDDFNIPLNVEIRVIWRCASRRSSEWALYLDWSLPIRPVMNRITKNKMNKQNEKKKNNENSLAGPTNNDDENNSRVTIHFFLVKLVVVVVVFVFLMAIFSCCFFLRRESSSVFLQFFFSS